MTLDDYRRLPMPASKYRHRTRVIILEVLDVLEGVASPVMDDNKALLARVDAAYCFGPRKYFPYKMWLEERRLFREALAGERALPSRDEATVCEVARDLVELGREADAITALGLAPNRLARRCVVCAAKPGQPCYGYDRLYLTVPHHARLVGHLDAGPLFAGSR